MSFLMREDADWQESFRRSVYPVIHDELSALGDAIGINLYATGLVPYNQYVGTLDESEDTIEEELVSMAANRNPVACLKELPDGRTSEGSWVFLHDDYPDLIEEGMQLHVTIFQREDGQSGREVYAHYEDDWRENPLAHLRAKNFSHEKGAAKATELLAKNSFLVLSNEGLHN